jgi:hypothetical protein
LLIALKEQNLIAVAQASAPGWVHNKKTSKPCKGEILLNRLALYFLIAEQKYLTPFRSLLPLIIPTNLSSCHHKNQKFIPSKAGPIKFILCGMTLFTSFKIFSEVLNEWRTLDD